VITQDGEREAQSARTKRPVSHDHEERSDVDRQGSRGTDVIDWPQIFYGAALSSALAAAVFVVVRRERTAAVLIPVLAAAFLGPLAWNAILHRVATDADGFFVDIPFKPFPVSWQDTGSGVFTLAAASLFLGVVLPHERARRVLGWAATAALVAFLVDIYLY
jgi:hypothetical protein